MVAQGHQGDDFTFVEINSERTFDRNSGFHRLVEFITGDYVGGGLEAGIGQFG